MRARFSPVACLIAVALVAVTGARGSGTPPGPGSAEFFEAKIRPVLVQHCQKCHSADAQSAKKLRGGLLLDTRAGVLTGGDSGPAVVPGKPGESSLVRSLKYADDLKMPPAGKLPDAVIADFEQWVAAGAHDPRTTDAGHGAVKKQVGMTVEAGREFWAFKPPVAAPPPAVKDNAWPANDLDRFVLAKLEAKGLAPAPDADPLTLLRRVTFDLTGLPPTPAEIDAFARDSARDPRLAFEAAVDRLLASPAFGERWGRHWLDVARYAESVTLRGMIFREAWRYRDYVIASVNGDKPFDEFLREQVAGDLMPAATPDDRRRQLVATTYLMLGNSNLEEQDKKQLRMDVVDEQIDVITRGVLAVTVSCARCHDHKFDPVPTADYYALAGILRNSRTLVTANVSNWTEVPLPLDPAAEKELAAREKRIAELQAKIKALGKTAAKPTGVLAVADVPGVVVDDADAKKVGDWQPSTHSGLFVGAGYAHDKNAGKGDKTLTFAPKLPADGKYEVRLAYSPGETRAAAVPVTVFGADGEVTVPVDMRKNPTIEGRFVSLGTFAFEKAGQSFVIVANEGTTGHVTADCVTFVPAFATPAASAFAAKPAAKGAELASLEAELKQLKAAGAGRPMVMAPVEESVVEDARVHVRGLVSNQGDIVPRGFLKVASRGPLPAMPAKASGRRELADWLASADNPLTARVYANRAWHWLFGAGLVRTVDNFGVAGETPSHPELLDYLAVRFVRNGWSVKQLVRLIVTSRTYRQAPADPAAAAADPDNRLLGRANRRRLDAECVRDGMLSAAGELAPFSGGSTIPESLRADYNHASPLLVRSVYLPALRNSTPDLLAAFDAADPSTVTGARNTSTVAPQALAMMNHPFVASRAAGAAKRLLEAKLLDDAARTGHAYRVALGRDPTAGERAVTAKFVTAGGERAWAAVFHALFASADFRFVD